MKTSDVLLERGDLVIVRSHDPLIKSGSEYSAYRYNSSDRPCPYKVTFETDMHGIVVEAESKIELCSNTTKYTVRQWYQFVVVHVSSGETIVFARASNYPDLTNDRIRKVSC